MEISGIKGCDQGVQPVRNRLFDFHCGVGVLAIEFHPCVRFLVERKFLAILNSFWDRFFVPGHSKTTKRVFFCCLTTSVTLYTFSLVGWGFTGVDYKT